MHYLRIDMGKTKYPLGENQLSPGARAKKLLKDFESNGIENDSYTLVKDLVSEVLEICDIYSSEGYTSEYNSIKTSITREINKVYPPYEKLEDNTRKPGYWFDESGTGSEGKKPRYRCILSKHFLEIEKLHRPDNNQDETEKEDSTESSKALQTNSTNPNTIEELIAMLSPETKAEAEKAIKELNIEWAELLERSVMGYCKTINRTNSFFDSDISHISTAELLSNSKYKTHPQRPHELVHRAIRAIKIWNEQHPDPIEQWAITQSAIQRLTGCDSNKCKEALSHFKTDVDDYNSKFEKLKTQNRKRSKDKIEDLLDIAALVPLSIDE